MNYPRETRHVYDPDVYRCLTCGSSLTGEEARGEVPHACGDKTILIDPIFNGPDRRKKLDNES